MLEPLGKVVVTTGGTPVAVSQNLAAGELPARPIQSLLIQALPGNAGIIYVRTKGTLADDRTTLRYTFGVIPKPANSTTGPFSSVTISIPVVPAAINLADIYIDASSSGDGALVAVTRG